MEYETLEPWGAWRDNWHAALIVTTLANVHRDPKRPPFKMDDFFYKDTATAAEDTDAATLAFFEGLADD